MYTTLHMYCTDTYMQISNTLRSNQAQVFENRPGSAILGARGELRRNLVKEGKGFYVPVIVVIGPSCSL